jgi:CheY-like chemotaxis protein
MARIMVVDDELFYRELVGDILKKAGHEVFAARDGKEALNLMTSHPDLDAVLLDVVMPGMDGLAVLSKLRGRDDSIPVIMISAHEDHRMVLQALRRGAFDYQRKPIGSQELALAVERALDHRKLLSEQRRKLERLASLENGVRRLSEMMTGRVTFEALSEEYGLLESTVKMVAEVLECERASLMLLDAKGEHLKVAVSVGLDPAMIKQESKSVKMSISRQVLESGEAMLVKNVAEDRRVQPSDFASQYKTRSFVAAPLKIGDQIVGTLNVNDKNGGAAFDEDDLYLLRSLSYHVSASLSHAIHASELERDRLRLLRLSEFQRILIHYLEPEKMLRDLLEKCQDMLDVVSAAVFLKDDFSEDLNLRVGFNGKKLMTAKMVVPWGESITGLVAKEGKTFILNNPEQDPRFIAETEWPGKGVIRTLLAAPIRLSNTTIGVIRLLNKRKGGFNEADAALLGDVADSLSIAIRNVKLYEQLSHSVEEIIAANRNLQQLNDELALKAKELELMQKMLAQGGS